MSSQGLSNQGLREFSFEDEDELENSIMWGNDDSTKKAGDSSYFV